ncbi:MAG: hypothetical protein Q7T82_14470 [Armatimonadota bacterium]|nr:hypothetical protein [Armatimonadota bacterium]
MYRSVAAFALLTTAALSVSPARAATPGGARKIVIVVAHGAMLEDITSNDLPSFRRLFNMGAGAVMTTRTAGDPGKPERSETGSEAACLTLGAGARAIGGVETRAAFNSDEIVDDVRARVLYRGLTLRRPPDGSVVMTGTDGIKSNNAPLPYSIRIGLLGDSLRRAGLVTACVGNSDAFRAPHREAAAICMDSAGIVDTGDVGRGLVRRSPASPYGVETSVKALLRAFDRVAPRANLIIVDTGDFARADWYADNCTEARAREMRRSAMLRVDRVIGELLRRLDLRSSRIIFLSPGPSRWKPYEKRKLAPVVMAGEGIAHGLLVSGSTRRPGLITNTDLAPDILEYFRLPVPASAVGRPLTCAPRSDPAALLPALDSRLSLQNDRLALMRLAAIILTVAVILGTILRKRGAIAGRLALLPALAAPLMVLLPAAGSYDATTSGAILAGAVVVVFLLLALLRMRAVRALLSLSAILCGAVVFDLTRGGAWLTDSPFSYSIAEAARFYGLGNEMMGSLIGAGAVVVFGVLGPAVGSVRFGRRLRTALCLACFGALAVLIGAPGFGANTGGALAGLATAGAALAVLADGKMNAKRWLVAAAVPIAVFALFLALDRLRGTGGESHQTRAFQMLSGGRAAEFGLIVARKVGMNLKLLQSSLWTKLLLACAGALIYLRATGGAIERPEWSRQAVKVIAAGAFAALIFNDSGVVAAATCLVYAWSVEMVTQWRVLSSE